MSINEIDHSTKNKLQSGQVILDLQGLSLFSPTFLSKFQNTGAIKELIENSLDASSTVIGEFVSISFDSILIPFYKRSTSSISV